MEATVLTSAAATTADDPDQPLNHYYQGQYRTVQNLIANLPAAVEATVHIIDPEYGIADGSDTYAAVTAAHPTPVGTEAMVQQAQSTLLEAVNDADVVVILLTTDDFSKIVEPIWTDLLEATQSDSIWCLGTSRSALESVGVDQLEATVDQVITYRRRGVARIGNEQKDALREAIAAKLEG